MPRPVITLTTDFGTTDSYVAQMKGVILGINPEVQIVDLVHSVAPQDVAGGARILAEAISAFPTGAIHLAVVDPGVGTNRSIIGVEAGGFRFVAPNNGLLWPALKGLTIARIHRLEEPRFRRPQVSTTFHGRDIMAPAAAHWSRGVDLAEFGSALSPDALIELPLRGPSRSADQLVGEVVAIDRFGNLITNISRSDLPAGDDSSLRIDISGRTVAGLHDCYAAALPGELLALFGSAGCLEIAANGGSAAALLGSTIGAAVTVRAAAPP
jgi:S-adenosyl-L-methionine hydrolase (adenosine-forming)